MSQCERPQIAGTVAQIIEQLPRDLLNFVFRRLLRNQISLPFVRKRRRKTFSIAPLRLDYVERSLKTYFFGVQRGILRVVERTLPKFWIERACRGSDEEH